MRVDKFYLDVTSDDGAGAICYAGTVGVLGLSVRLASTLRWAGTRGSAQQRNSTGAALPVVDGKAIHWCCPELDVDGIWTPRCGAIDAMQLCHDGNQSVRWRLLAAKADVSVAMGGKRITGFGYVERLQLTGAPWRLPIDQLRWGRFISDQHTVVWIDWAHPSPRRWVWHNGLSVAATVEDAVLVWAGHRLEMKPSRVLRDGQLGTTALRRWPLLRRFLPGALCRVHETKWCSSGELLAADGTVSTGWAIHETVRFR